MTEVTPGRDIKHHIWDEEMEGGKSRLVAVHPEVLVLPLPRLGGHLLDQWGPAGLVHHISGKCAGRKGFPKKTESTQRKS